MNKNVRIAKELVRIAKQLLAARPKIRSNFTFSEDNFKKLWKIGKLIPSVEKFETGLARAAREIDGEDLGEFSTVFNAEYNDNPENRENGEKTLEINVKLSYRDYLVFEQTYQSTLPQEFLQSIQQLKQNHGILKKKWWEEKRQKELKDETNTTKEINTTFQERDKILGDLLKKIELDVDNVYEIIKEKIE